MKYLFLILIYCFATFVPTYSQDLHAQTDKSATVYFIRPNAAKILLNVSLYHQGEYIGRLKAMGCSEYKCAPGRQLFWGVAGNQYFIELNVEAGETYVIKEELVKGMQKRNVRLILVDKMDQQYNELRTTISRKKLHNQSIDKIEKTNTRQQIRINRYLANYNEKNKAVRANSQQSITNQGLISSRSIIDIRKAPIIFDYNLVDFPFSKKSIESTGIGGLFSNPSMSQSLNLTSSFYSTTREGLYRLMSKSDKIRKMYKLAFVTTDFLTFAYMPLTDGWMHEEFHRAVFTKNGGYSYNDMNKFPFFSELISVSHVADNNLISLKKNHPTDMVRMSEAGIEGEYMLSNQMNKIAFYNNSKSQTLIPLLSTISCFQYVRVCSTKDADNMTDDSNTKEGSNVAKRDLVGLDFLAWVYDLHRPNESYESRGLHPSGVGINRYIKRSQLTHNELSYLKTQGYLQLINFLNPMLFFKNSFTIQEKENGDDTRANVYLNYWLSPFGFDISASGLLHYNHHNYSFTLHNYANHYHWFPGIEMETYNYQLGESKLKRPILASANVMFWVQPKNQLFFAKKGSIGGCFETKIYYPFSKYFQPYISVSAKTNGWVQGNVYLEKNISAAVGLRAYF